MAHGFECATCGYNETAHQDPVLSGDCCADYASPDPSKEAQLWSAQRMRDRDQASRKRQVGGVPDGL